MKEIVLASCNVHKIEEISNLLHNNYALISQIDMNVKDIPETGDTFIDNALIKANHLASMTDKPVLADDSGLIIDALDGRPGILSARFAGPNATVDDNRKKLSSLLIEKDLTATPARYHTVLVLIYDKNKDPLISKGDLSGTIKSEYTGDGFGYDPMFYPKGYSESFAELNSLEKNKISHRGQALKKLMDKLNKT